MPQASAFSKVTHSLLTPDWQMACLSQAHLLSTPQNQKKIQSPQLQAVPPTMRPLGPPQLGQQLLHKQAVDDGTISNQTTIYPGDPQVITPNHSNSLHHTTSMMADFDEEFESLHCNGPKTHTSGWNP
jgi:hypothetical protein